MQRFFWGFPAGRPGVGLLLLRVAVAAELVAIYAADPATPGRVPWLAAAVVAAVALVLGVLTPLAGLLALTLALGAALAPQPALHGLNTSTALLLAAMAAVVVLMGPGSLSLDARRFGRREIVIPHATRPPDL